MLMGLSPLLQSGREARRPQIGMKRVLQQLDDHGGPGAAAEFLPGAKEGLLDEPGQLQRHPELAAEAEREAQVLAGEVHGEADIVAAVQNYLALGLVDEAVAG